MSIRRIVVIAVLPLAFGLSACGSGNAGSGVASHSSGTASAPSSLSPQDAQLKFAQCMRENGVNIPDPVPGQPIRLNDTNVAADKMEAATKTCQRYLQAGGMLNPYDPAVHDAMVKFTECMRQHGVDIPDPAADGKMQVPTGVPQDKLQAAQQACQQLLPGAGG